LDWAAPRGNFYQEAARAESKRRLKKSFCSKTEVRAAGHGAIKMRQIFLWIALAAATF